MQSTKKAAQLEQFSDLIHQIYAASAEPRRWPDTVGVLAQAMGAMRALLFTPYVAPDSGGLLFPWRIDEKDLILWGSKYIDHDIWSQAVQRKGLWKEAAVLLDSDMVPQDEFLGSVFYREFLSTMGIARVCTGVVFEGSPGLPITALAVFRGHDKPFREEERELMRLLVPHLSRALGLMHRLNQARYQLESLHAALNRLSVGVFLLNQHMQVIYANTAGQQVLDRADGLQLDLQQRLTAPGLQQSGGLRLEAWLTRLAAIPKLQRSSFADTFEVMRNQAQAQYSVQCCPLEPSDPLAKSEGAHHIVFVTDPQRLELPARDQLQRQFGLTPAEARVTHAMVQGGSYNDVATSLGVSEETIRTQIRATYAKTRTSDKASLTRMLLSLGKAIV